VILWSAYLLEGPVKVRDQVIDVLDPHRDPDQGVGQSALFPDFLGHRSVGHQGGMFDERFHPSRLSAKAKSLTLFQESFGFFQLSFDLKGEHSSVSRGLAIG